MSAAIQHLGQPCIARNVLAGRLVREGDREWFVLTNMNETAGMELIFIDPAEDRADVYRAPAGAGAWALLPVGEPTGRPPGRLPPGDRLAVGTFYDGSFMLFDVPRRTWIETVRFPGESYLSATLRLKPRACPSLASGLQGLLTKAHCPEGQYNCRGRSLPR
jgi:hypothetical protein